MDRPGDQFLARAALAQDEHGDVLRRHTAHGLVDFLHHLAAANKRVRRFRRRFFWGSSRNAHQVTHRGGALDQLC